jgi:hypothetical protein
MSLASGKIISSPIVNDFLALAILLATKYDTLSAATFVGFQELLLSFLFTFSSLKEFNRFVLKCSVLGFDVLKWF